MAEGDIQGLNELGKFLKTLPERLHRDVLQGATLAGAKVLEAPTRAAAPVFTGRLEESIVAASESKSKAGKRFWNSGRLFASAGLKIKGVASHYWHLPEFGTVKMAARPFLRPTFAAQQGNVLRAMKDYIAKRLPREAAKLAKETGAKK